MRYRLPGDVVIFIIPVAVFIYLSSSFSWYSGTPRYLFVLFPVTSIGFALVVHWVSETMVPAIVQKKAGQLVTRLVAAIVIVALIGFFSWQTLWNSHNSLAGSRGFVTDSQLEAADQYLAGHDIVNVYAEYWTALPSQYFAEATLKLNKVHIAPWGVGQGKAGVSVEEVDASPDFAYMTGSRTTVQDGEVLRAALAAHRITYKETRVGPVTIYTNLSQYLRPAQLGLTD